jgi:PAS domain S-box-containing protein
VDIESFSAQVRGINERVAGYRLDWAGAPDDRAAFVDQVFETLSVALEELRVAEQQIQQQSAELKKARRAADLERLDDLDLFDQAADVHFVTSLVGSIRKANSAAARLLNVPAPFLRHKPLASFVAGPDRREFRATLNALCQTSEPRRWRGRLIPRRGDPIDVAMALATVRSTEGQPIGLRVLVRDLNGRANTEDALRALVDRPDARAEHCTTRLEMELHSKEQLLALARATRADAEGARRRLAELVDGVIPIVYEAEALSGRFTLVSRSAEDLLGHPPEAWTSRDTFWIDLIHPDDREDVITRRRQNVVQRKEHELEYRALTAAGGIVWVRDIARVTADDRGAPALLRGVITSVGRRKRLERNLYHRRHEAEMQSLDMAHLHDLTLRLSPSLDLAAVLDEVLTAATAIQGAEMGLVRLVDPERGDLVTAAGVGFSAEALHAFERMPAGAGECGLALAERRRVVIEDVEKAADYAPWLPLARLAGYRAVFCTPLFRRDGTPLGTLATYFRDPHRPPDRQARLVELYACQASQLLEHARLLEHLREADRRKDAFLALVGHELRNPLSSVSSAAQLLAMRGADDELLGMLQRQIGHMTRLVEDLLDVARVNRGELSLRRERFEAALAVSRAVETVRPVLDERKHDLDVLVDPAPAVIDGDPTRLVQVLANLLDNAAKYSEPGERVALSAGLENGDVVFRVRDHGRGIAPEMLLKVFEPFVQEARSTGRGGGLGLGLTLVRRLVELHGGRVEATSAGPGQGSEFVVRLPAAGSNGRPGPVAAPPEPRLSEPHVPPPRRALVVDDDPSTARSLARLLRVWGFEVGVAENGPDALEQARRLRPDVALLDIGLPGIDGREVARRIRQEAPGPVLLLAVTAYSDPDDLRLALEAGFDHYLVKPIDLDVLRDRLARVAPAPTG